MLITSSSRPRESVSATAAATNNKYKGFRAVYVKLGRGPAAASAKEEARSRISPGSEQD
jgi:hypothetical protein